MRLVIYTEGLGEKFQKKLIVPLKPIEKVGKFYLCVKL